MLSSMAVIRSAAEDARLHKLGLRWGGNHPNARRAEDGCTRQHIRWLLCVHSRCLTHTVWTHALILKLLSAGLSLWHAANPWDKHGFYYGECKWNLFFCLSDTVALTLCGNDTPLPTPPTPPTSAPPLHPAPNTNTASEIWRPDQTSLHWMKSRFHQTVTASDNLIKTVEEPKAKMI